MSGGGEIVFVPVLIPLAVGVGVVFVAVGAGVGAAYLADLGADAGIEAIRLMGQIGVRAGEHLVGEYDKAVRRREQRSVDALREEILTRSAQRAQADRALHVIERTRTRLSGSATVDLLIGKTQELLELSRLVKDAELQAEVARLQTTAQHTAPSAMVKNIIELQRRLIGQVEREVRAEAEEQDPAVRRDWMYRELLRRSEQSIRVTLTDLFIPDDKRAKYSERLDQAMQEVDAVGLDATVRTIRTLEENIVREAREAMVAEVTYRRAYARAVSAVDALLRTAPADPRAQVIGHALQMELEQLAEKAATAAEVGAIGERAEAEKDAASKRWDTLSLAATSQAVVAKALTEQGCKVHYVAPDAVTAGQEPMIIEVDAHVGVKITFETDDERGAVVAHTEMVAFDADHAVADDVAQTRVCRFVEELARRMGAEGFKPRWVEAGRRLEIVAPPNQATDDQTFRRRRTVLKALEARN